MATVDGQLSFREQMERQGFNSDVIYHMGEVKELLTMPENILQYKSSSEQAKETMAAEMFEAWEQSLGHKAQLLLDMEKEKNDTALE